MFMNEVKVRFRKVLLSSGEFTTEAVLYDGNTSVFESSPEGLTIGLKEKEKGSGELPADFSFTYEDAFPQSQFDAKIAEKYDSEVSTALSLAYLRYKAIRTGIQQTRLSSYIASEYNIPKSTPRIIFNILNGGKHAKNGLSFCEFMIIPKTDSAEKSIKIASDVYLDLRDLIIEEYGEKNVFVGREGGFAPDINNIEVALDLIIRAVSIRHNSSVSIAIDVAANNFSSRDEKGDFIYAINGVSLSTDSLFNYYKFLTEKHPEINYIEDAFHEDDVTGWSLIMNGLGSKIDVVADDLTVSNINYAKQHKDLFNSCVLKVNQVGTVSELIETLKFCKQNNIKTIISQRSGETDSNILPHLAVGLGADYMKAGAPARERIVKYNELLRILT